MKEAKPLDLFDGIDTVSSITCSGCHKKSDCGYDAYDAADYFYHLGWRKMNDKVYCASCINKDPKLKYFIP